jgi:glutamate formiminotransferase/formiminotetrahydrofolate cyclodeaminase
MAQQIIECVPNFSEGHRKSVVDAIVNAIQSVDGVALLDRSSDPDHNRSVITFVGDGKTVAEAAFRGIAKAAELIDMTKHKGEHPRMGAADVVPFVPISGASMQDCVQIARSLGKRVGAELGLPVYLYEEAATRPERHNLEDVRRGEYEGIREAITTDAARKPDFGPSLLGKAGAIAIGARAPLIAYNVYLDSEDVEIAKKIAKAVRHSSGGLRFVKGAGFLVDGKAQVSMNLTDFRKTPVARVMGLVRREARRYGTHIGRSELIGLVPQEALEDAAAWYLQLKDFDRQQVLERRMQTAIKAEAAQTSDASFLEALASADPTPGGGSAAAQAGAMAAALVAMVARLTVGKKKYAAVEEQMAVLIDKADSLRVEFTNSVKKDAAAFEAVMAALKLPKETKRQLATRARTLHAATLEAARQPLAVARLAIACLELARQAAELGNTNAISDAGTAAALARASLQGAGLNVRINLHSLEANKQGVQLLKELRTLEKQATKLETAISKQVHVRGGFEIK